MNKTLFFLTIFSLFSCLLSCASWQRTSPELISKGFVYVVDVPNKSKAVLYKESRIWVADTFNSAKDVFTFEEQEAGIIKGTGMGSAKAKGDMFTRDFRYNFSINVKDNKTRIKFSNIRPVQRGEVAGLYMRIMSGYNAVKYYCNSLAMRYEMYLQSNKKDDEW